LESSVRVCSFFREVFVLFSFCICICLERASFWDFVVLLLLFLLFLLSFYWLLVGVVCSFFREVFVLFSFNFRSSFVYVWSEHHCGFAVVFMNGFVASSVRCLLVFF
jgi:hypothetical protein